MPVFEGTILVEFIVLTLFPSHRKIFEALDDIGPGAAKVVMKGKRK
jgi:hypothetical protein